MTVTDLMGTSAGEMLVAALPKTANEVMAYLMSGKALVQMAAAWPELTKDRLDAIERELADIV